MFIHTSGPLYLLYFFSVSNQTYVFLIRKSVFSILYLGLIWDNLLKHCDLIFDSFGCNILYFTQFLMGLNYIKYLKHLRRVWPFQWLPIKSSVDIAFSISKIVRVRSIEYNVFQSLQFFKISITSVYNLFFWPILISIRDKSNILYYSSIFYNDWHRTKCLSRHNDLPSQNRLFLILNNKVK